MRKGQAMLETVLAVLFITTIFLGLFQLSHTVTAKILLDHAAARAARAKAVGFNDFMCVKSARVALIPVSGRRLTPDEQTFTGEGFADYGSITADTELSRIPTYLATENEATAAGVLDYRGWHDLGFRVTSEIGESPVARADVEMTLPRLTSWGDTKTEDRPIEVSGHAEIESHFPFYMFNQGL